MSESKHALLSASSAYRWMACPPSAMATKDLPEETSVFAEEGIKAHEVAEYKIKQYLRITGLTEPDTGEFDADEIDDNTDIYLNYIIGKAEAAKKDCPTTLVLVEQKLDLSAYVPDSFGTVDSAIVTEGSIRVIDFKYGMGAPVKAENNAQMMLYALGILSLYGNSYDVKNVSMAIVQPRRKSMKQIIKTIPAEKGELYATSGGGNCKNRSAANYADIALLLYSARIR